MKDFNLILKQERRIASLNKTEAARLLEVPYRTFLDWERGTTAPPDYVQKAILYCFDAIRCDLLAGELRAELLYKKIDPRELIQVERDELGRIIDWHYSERRTAEIYQIANDDEIKSLEAINVPSTEYVTIGEAYQEVALRNPYLTEEEAESLYPDD